MIRLYFGAISLGLVLVLLGCSGSSQERASGVIEETSSLTLMRQLAIGDSTGAYFGHIVDLDVDSGGRIYVCDNQIHTVWVFSPEGDSLRTVGRAGQGPGEFMRMIDIEIGSNDSLFTFDRRTGRITAFGPTPAKKYVYTTPVPKAEIGLHNGFFKPDTSGFLVTYQLMPSTAKHMQRKSSQWIGHIGYEGAIWRDSILVVSHREWITGETDRGTLSIYRPFGRKPVIRRGPENEIYYGWSDSLAIGRYDLNGTMLDQTRISREVRSVDDEDVQSYIAWQEASRAFGEKPKRLIEEAELPQTYPAFDDFVVDDEGKLWIKRSGPVDQPAKWVVVDPEKQEAAGFALPQNESINVVKKGRVYTIRERESGLQDVIVYRVQ